MTKDEDNEYEEYKIESVEPVREGPKMWLASLEHGYTITLPRGGGAKQPKEGMTVKIYGDIEISDVRGIDLDDVQVFYRTPEEHAVWLREQEADAAKTALASYSVRKHEFDQRIKQLPPELGARIDHLRGQSANADTFNALYLESEIAASEPAWWLSQLIYTKVDLGIFSSIPSISKGGSVYAQMCDDIRAKLKNRREDGPTDAQTPEQHAAELVGLKRKCDAVDKTAFIIDAGPEWYGKVFELALTLIGDEDAPIALPEGPKAVTSAEDMLP